MKIKNKLYLLTIILLILIVLFIGIGLNTNNWKYVLSRRIPKVLAILFTGSAIAFSSTIFQTITNNRILTPNILGLDSLYNFIQTFIVFIFGSNAIARIDGKLNFLLSVGFMSLFAIVLFKLLFKKEGNNLIFMLLIGMVFGTFFQSLSSFMQVLIDPNEFLNLQNKMFASFNNINTNVLWLASIGMFISFIFIFKHLKSLDIISLGRENAINLGIDHDKVVKFMLIIISILVSISTALVGPIMFLGVLVVNINREFLDTYKHKYLIVGAMLKSSIFLIGGQLIAERIMSFSTPINVVINFIGGLYFISLILKEDKI
ncbi:MAG: iron chelate uptake ABC transporter family permease subunit [Clostridiales bacterium]|nr:iron chelate uptake ABC transporter family permease subunit [Clostridiales bacterium]